MIHDILENKHRTGFGFVLLLSCASLIYWCTGDAMRAVTALIAFSPCAFLLGGSTAAAGAELSLVRRGIFLRTSRVLVQLGRTENIAFDSTVLSRMDSLGAELPRIVTALRHMGLHPILLTDEDRETAERIGAAADISDLRCAADVEHGSTAPLALVGLHRCAAHGSSIRLSLRHISSTSATDAVILGSHLNQLPVLIRMARRTRTKIEQNEVFGHTLNYIGIGLAVAGVLTPISAALWHAASALLILLNARSLLSVGAHEKKFAF